MPSWTHVNERYVLPARKLLLGGRAREGEELLRRGVEESGDGWLMFQLAEFILVTTPDDASRIDEACHFYARSITRLPNEGYRRLAESALAKGKAMLTLAPSASAQPKSLLPTADGRPAPRRAEVAEEKAPPKPPDPIVVKLKELCGFDAFKPGQREIVEVLLKGRSALAVMPTGSGRSLCYKFPSQLLEGATLVLSTRANGAGVEALREGKTKLAYVDPGAALPQDLKISLLVVDEAQRVSEWSHDFRPDYLRLKEAIARINPAAVLAVTATATQQVRADIVERLGLVNPFTHIGSFDRPNLVWSAIDGRGLDKLAALKQVLNETPGPSIVYTGRGADADYVAKALQSVGIPAAAWHEEMAPELRDESRDLWRSGRKTVIAATAGFGSGIDKADVRSVVHWQMPASPEEYVRQAGRAGRDGKTAQCVMLFDPEEKEFQRGAIDRAHPDRATVLLVLRAVTEKMERGDIMKLRDPGQISIALAALEKQGYIATAGPAWERVAEAPNESRLDLSELERKRRQAEERLSAIERYAEARGCRRRELLQWFGERFPSDWQCAGCDRCRKARDGGDDEYKAATLRAAVMDGVKDLESKHLTVQEMARAMLFLAPAAVTRALKGKNEAEVRDLINALLRAGQLELDPRVPWVKRKR